MGTLHHNANPHKGVGIKFETPSEFRIKVRGHLPELARNDKGMDEERRASVASIQVVRLTEARAKYRKPRPVRTLSPYEEGLRARKFDPVAAMDPEWVDGWEARAAGQNW